MISGIGTDIVEINRFQRFVNDNNHILLQRLFTAGELEYCRPKKNSAASYAGRFAAKEAFLKALGTGLRDGISWHDMEVVNNPQGKPELLLTAKALELFRDKGLNNIFLSISHDGGHAIAMIVLEST